MSDRTLAEQFEALSEDQKHEVAQAMASAMARFGLQLAQAISSFAAAAAPLTRQIAALGEALGTEVNDEAGGGSWSDLMATIDTLTGDQS